MMNKTIAKIFRKFGYSLLPTAELTYQKFSFSQCGEDAIIDYIFKLRGISKPTYIDIGANHPFYLNNTAMFYKKGSRGVNIEANPMLLDRFKLYRPQDININIGISDKPGQAEFFIMEDNTLSTFSGHEVEKMINAGKKLASTIKINLITVDDVLKEYCNGVFPDILSLDVEGLDFQILKTIDFAGNAPKVICVEAAEYSSNGTGERRDDLIDFLAGMGYYEYANTNLNAIMVQNSFWFKA